jgi:hypothetical protein
VESGGRLEGRARALFVRFYTLLVGRLKASSVRLLPSTSLDGNEFFVDDALRDRDERHSLYAHHRTSKREATSERLRQLVNDRPA